MPKVMKIVALAGGVGGAKMVDGLAQCLPPDSLKIIANTGDDFTHYGLKICPDLDTVCYTLADLANPETGWGRNAETFQVLDELTRMGEAPWFRLGDRDLATHLFRTSKLMDGIRLTQVIKGLCSAWHIEYSVFPMCDEAVSTKVITSDGRMLEFQEYFVKESCVPCVNRFLFEGIEKATLTPEIEEALFECEAVILCPSNPFVSIDPILSVPRIRELISTKKVIAISPIIGGKTVKGPAAKMFLELGLSPTPLAVADHFRGILNGFVMDNVDEGYADEINRWGIITSTTNSIMKDKHDRKRLALEVLDLVNQLF